MQQTLEDRIFSAAMSCRPLETTLWLDSGEAVLARLVTLPVPLPDRVELAWRCRHVITGNGNYTAKGYPDSVTGAAALIDSIPWTEKTSELLKKARTWSCELEKKVSALCNSLDPEYVKVLRRLSIQPFPVGYEYDPLHKYRLLMLRASVRETASKDELDLAALVGPQLRPLNDRDLDELRGRAIKELSEESTS